MSPPNLIIANRPLHICSQTVRAGDCGMDRLGLNILLNASIPEASHDSSAHPPLPCHPGAWQDYADRLIRWGFNNDNHVDRIAWLKGPSDAGKSAVAQFCAEALEERLGASFFFSHSHERDNPHRLFTSISYQLGVKNDLYGDLLDHKIRRDPTLVGKSVRHQFRDLLEAPIRELKERGTELAECVIIVDGLDKCGDRREQLDIIKVVAESVQRQSTPFLWIFSSRIEPHLSDTFGSPSMKSLVPFQVELPAKNPVGEGRHG